MAKDNFCIYCGFKLFPEDHFCPNCGKKLDDVAEAPKKSTKYEPSKVVDGIDLSQVNKAKKTTQNNYSSHDKTKYTTTTPDYTIYKNQVKQLKETYETKEKKVLELLEKKFPSGQMSYYRFSEKIAKELKNKIKILQQIVGKLNDLQSELIISISNGDDEGHEEIKNLIDEMNELIDSVKNYE